jgi:tetratricopeptide (TPR) repeat protein
MAYTKQHKLDDAILEYEKALAIDPDYAKVHYNLAITHYKKGNHTEAMKHCDRASELGVEIHQKVLESLKPYR